LCSRSSSIIRPMLSRHVLYTPPFPYTTLFRSGGEPHELGFADVSENRTYQRTDGATAQAGAARATSCAAAARLCGHGAPCTTARDRKSTRLNSSHVKISYAVFCLKKRTPIYRR